MNILHTSDWHIGKRLMDRERLPEQIAALDEIVRICDERDVDLVLVAGDVFDTYMPSADAEEVFFRAVKRIAGEKRAVVIVSGNHDDGVRLAASAPLAAEEGIYLFGGGYDVVPVGGERAVKAVASGEGYVVIANARGEQVYINALPYPNEARLKEEMELLADDEIVLRRVRRERLGLRYIELYLEDPKSPEHKANVDAFFADLKSHGIDRLSEGRLPEQSYEMMVQGIMRTWG